MRQNRWKIYMTDLLERGVKYFVLSRLKKHPFTRWLWYLKQKPYVLIYGKKLSINKMDQVLTEVLINEGIWEPFITKLFLKYAKTAKSIVDVGANIGYYTLLASTKSPSGSRVIAFEPDRENVKLLEHTIEENNLNNVTVEQKAIGDINKLIKLYKCKENRGDHRCFDSGNGRDFDLVNMVTLDKYFSGNKSKIDLLKIDVQGYEFRVLRGAGKLLKNKCIKVILSELWPSGLQMVGDSWKEYINILINSGFHIWQVDERKARLNPFNEKIIDSKTSENGLDAINILAILKE